MVEGGVSIANPFETLGNNAGTRFKTRSQHYGYTGVTLYLDDAIFPEFWRSHESFGFNPPEIQILDGYPEWFFHHMDISGNTLECVFTLRYKNGEGYDEYTLRLVLDVSGEEMGVYMDPDAEIYITHGAQWVNPNFPPGPKKETHHHSDQFTVPEFTVPITIEIQKIS